MLVNEIQTYEAQQQYVEVSEFTKSINRELEICNQEGIRIDDDAKILFDIVIPAFASGTINYHGHDYELGFSTKIEIQQEQLILQTQYEKNDVPILEVQNLGNFVEELNSLVETIREQAPRLRWLESQNGNSTKDIVRETLLQMWFNATEYDFANPEQFLRKQKLWLKDNTFSEMDEGLVFDGLQLAGDKYLFVKRSEQSGSNETPYILEVDVIPKEFENVHVDLPIIRYSIAETPEGRTAYVFAVQSKKKSTDVVGAPEQEKQAKKVNRALYKLSEGIMDLESDEYKDYIVAKRQGNTDGSFYPENITDVSQSSIYSLAIMLTLLRRKGITKIEVPAYLPLRWQAHARLGEKENERIQTNVSDKFLRNFRRLSHQLDFVKVVDDGVDTQTMVLKIDPNPDRYKSSNPTLQNVLEVIQ
jgi:hypothetical protein